MRRKKRSRQENSVPTALEPSDSIEIQAYQEAGHAVMRCLILGGYVRSFIPLSMGGIFPELKLVSLENQSTDWNQLGYNLGSMLTVSQVLLAGYISKQIKSNTQAEGLVLHASLPDRAFHLLCAYTDEYYNYRSLKERDQIALPMLQEMFAYVTNELQSLWSAVVAVAGVLLEQKALTPEQIKQMVEQYIPQEKQEEAQRFLKGDQLDPETRKWIEELRVKHRNKAKNNDTAVLSNKE